MFQLTSVNPDRPGNGTWLTLNGWVRREHASKWPVSNWVLVFTCRAAHGTMFYGADVLYSGW